MIEEDEIRRIDAANMRELIVRLPEQILDALRIVRSTEITVQTRRIRNIVVTGLGGSAIGGDLLRSYSAGEIRVPMVINRNYTLPRFVNEHTLVIVSSYSGNTEETIAAHREAARRKAQVVAITSNGETARIATRLRHPLISIPKGLPPRAALAYSFFPPLALFTRWGFLRSKTREISETIDLLKTKAAEYAVLDPDLNPALRLAERLKGTLPIVYAASDHFDAVALRWRGQLEENAKVLAYGNVFPELTHNEIVGWRMLPSLLENTTVIFLRDLHDHTRVKLRMDITKSIINKYTSRVIEVQSEGTSLLARIFSLLYLGDWVSFYLAILTGVDPTPVEVIDHLKEKLAET